jgi:hypothetical protein
MVAALQTPTSRPSRISGRPANQQLARNPEPHWKKTNVLIVKNWDTGKMNALREKGEPKGPLTGVMGPGSLPSPPPEPMLTLQLGGKSVKFLCHTGAAYSVI